MSTSSQWYVKIKEKIQGPFSSKQLKSLAASGKLKATMQLRRGEEGKWVVASAVKGLFPAAPEPEEFEPLEIIEEPVEVEPLEVVELAGLDVEPLDAEPIDAEPIDIEPMPSDPFGSPSQPTDLLSPEMLSAADAVPANQFAPQPTPAPQNNPFQENPYQAAVGDPAKMSGQGAFDAVTHKKLEALIKDAGQFWLALLLCLLCSGIGPLIICPWYTVRLIQWNALAKLHPVLVDRNAPPGSYARKFQGAKTKLIIGLVGGVLLLGLVVLYLISLASVSTR